MAMVISLYAWALHAAAQLVVQALHAMGVGPAARVGLAGQYCAVGQAPVGALVDVLGMCWLPAQHPSDDLVRVPLYGPPQPNGSFW